jgi:hypothetical protein
MLLKPGVHGKRNPLDDAIMMIDFIEHLTMPRRYLIGAMPLGCQEKDYRVLSTRRCPQDADTYALGGDKWQTHRSTWSVEQLKSRDLTWLCGLVTGEAKTLVAFAVWSRNS